MYLYFFLLLFLHARAGEVWKKTRSSAAKQIIPRRVGNFVEPLCEITEDFLDHLETKMDDSGNVADMPPEINKWAFQGHSPLMRLSLIY